MGQRKAFVSLSKRKDWLCVGSSHRDFHVIVGLTLCTSMTDAMSPCRRRCDETGCLLSAALLELTLLRAHFAPVHLAEMWGHPSMCVRTDP